MPVRPEARGEQGASSGRRRGRGRIRRSSLPSFAGGCCCARWPGDRLRGRGGASASVRGRSVDAGLTEGGRAGCGARHCRGIGTRGRRHTRGAGKGRKEAERRYYFIVFPFFAFHLLEYLLILTGFIKRNTVYPMAKEFRRVTWSPRPFPMRTVRCIGHLAGVYTFRRTSTRDTCG